MAKRAKRAGDGAAKAKRTAGATEGKGSRTASGRKGSRSATGRSGARTANARSAPRPTSGRGGQRGVVAKARDGKVGASVAKRAAGQDGVPRSVGGAAGAPVGSVALEAIDRELVKAALQKRQAGRPISRDERRALTAWEKAKWEETTWRVYRAIPKRHYCEMSGRSVHVLNKQARHHRMPVGGPVVNLPELLSWLHDFLARNARKLSTADGEESIPEEVSKRIKNRYWDAKARILEMEVKSKDGTLLPREAVHAGLAIYVNAVQRAGEGLERAFGDRARAMLDAALEKAARSAAQKFGVKNDDPPPVA